MKRFGRFTSWMLTLAMLVGLFGGISVQAADASNSIPAAYRLADLGGGAEADRVEAQIGWTNDALPQEQMKALINSQELHPQLTGYAEMDEAIDKILSAVPADADAYTKIQTVYEWIIEHVVYTHNGYGYVEGATNTFDFFQRNFYTEKMTKTEGISHFIPDKVVNHASYALFENLGACYDFASLLTIAIRHVGINAYVHTGYWILETDGSTNNHHGWTEIELDGALYIIDPQREMRYASGMGYNCNIYFGIPHTDGRDWRYWKPDTEANAARDALFTSVTVDQGTGSGSGGSGGSPVDPVEPVPQEDVTMQVVITGNGTVTCDAPSTGPNTYQVKTGDKVHLEAVPGENSAFKAWWDKSKRSYLQSTNPDYETASQLSADEGVTFFVDPENLLIHDGVLVIEAEFAETTTLTVVSSRSGSVKSDGFPTAGPQQHVVGSQVNLSAEPSDKFSGWYDSYGNLLGTDPNYSFDISSATTVYALFDGDVFCDLKPTDWYLEEALEAAKRGLVKGTTQVVFDGEAPYTRAMAAVMLARLDQADLSTAPAAPFTDVPQDAWFAKEVNWAYANKVITGRDATSFDPDASITREEFFAMVVRYLNGKGYQVEGAVLPYSDVGQITFAQDLLAQAQAMGLLKGDTEGTLRPTQKLIRCEGAAIILRAAEYIDNH